LARSQLISQLTNGQGIRGLRTTVWIGFQATSIVGSVIHEHYPWRLYAIHSGDELAKTPVLAVILGLPR